MRSTGCCRRRRPGCVVKVAQRQLGLIGERSMWLERDGVRVFPRLPELVTVGILVGINYSYRSAGFGERVNTFGLLAELERLPAA